MKFGASQSSKRGAFARAIFSGRAVSGSSTIAEPIARPDGLSMGLLLSLTIPLYPVVPGHSQSMGLLLSLTKAA